MVLRKDAGPQIQWDALQRIGNTSTLAVHGRRVSTPSPGDLVFCFWPISHVCVYIGGGRVVSHGHEGPPDDPAIFGLFAVNEIRSYV